MSKLNAVYNFGKALHHASAAKFYMELASQDIKPVGSAKQLLKDLINRQRLIVTILMDKLSPEGQQVMKDELSDPLAMDVIADLWLGLDDEGRAKAEQYLDTLYQQQKQIQAA